MYIKLLKVYKYIYDEKNEKIHLLFYLKYVNFANACKIAGIAQREFRDMT